MFILSPPCRIWGVLVGNSWSCICSVLVPARAQGHETQPADTCRGRTPQGQKTLQQSSSLGWALELVSCSCACMTLLQAGSNKSDRAGLPRWAQVGHSQALLHVPGLCGTTSPWQGHNSPCCPPALKSSCARNYGALSGLTSPLLLQGGPCSVIAALNDPEHRTEMSHWVHQSSAGWHSRARVQLPASCPWVMVVLPPQDLPMPEAQCWGVLKRHDSASELHFPSKPEHTQGSHVGTHLQTSLA